MGNSIIQKAALKLLKENIALKKGEKVAVVTDRKKCKVFDAVCSAVNSLGGELITVGITDKRTSSQPLPKLKEIFLNSDVIIGITDKSVTHCPETRDAVKRGARAVTMPGIDEKLFLKAMSANLKRIKKLGQKISAMLKKSKTVKIKTPSGTDLIIPVVKKEVGIDDGDSTKKRTINNIPYGEVSMLPIDIADGILAIDFSRINVKQRDKVKLILRKGKITGYNNRKAWRFIKYLKKTDGKKAMRIVELGIGINPAHKKLTGKILHDEKIFGSAHIAFGGYGSRRKCKIHEDVMLLKPTIYFDSKLVVRNGKII